MPIANRPPGRNTRDYIKLNRWVISNHLKTENAKKKEPPSPNPITNFFHNKYFTWLKHYLKSRFGQRHKILAYPIENDNGIYKMESHSGGETVKIALISDWATDTEESRQIGTEVEKHKTDYTVHLGDTYFVGTPEEIEKSFNPLNSFWPYGAVGSFALAGNHEMYSNGNPYYHILLPWMGLKKPERVLQKASYVCLENEFWRIIGLDTGHQSVGIPVLEMAFANASLHIDEYEWLNHIVKIRQDNRGLIILTHHQNVSAFSRNYPSAGKQLKEIIGGDRQALWFWGHEHRFAIYGRNSSKNSIASYGRCIGHGGMPIDLEKNPEKIKQEKSDLVLYDNRFRKEIKDTNLGHNGYAILTIKNEILEIEYFDETKLLVSEIWVYNQATQAIEGKEINIHTDDLEIIKDVSYGIGL